ncbi:TonB-dependent siderophore receptor [Leptolyngbya sp. 7M]|uniref:TonB-dependent siderophore receptor n=1 Tax=Leptolyngbya sp. 7M TaxID=2812896 RepID=UPI001B8D5BA6|nr:TonB-dependent siderophore receptor [Leptolyngbya sp. 7M]QYO62236.1 TonB-dependent siderophore receptor [Leptolyngbya sp. 7M]
MGSWKKLSLQVRLWLLTGVSGCIAHGLLILPAGAQVTSPQPSPYQGEGVETGEGADSGFPYQGGIVERSASRRVGGNAELQPVTAIPHLGELEQPATTIEDWVAQIEASLVQITDVRVEATEAGLQVILETAEGSLEAPETRSVGNALIADIPNAAIAEDFSQAEPIEGIALVSVTSLPDNRVRVAITGTEAPPVAEVTAEAQGLTLAVTLGDADTVAEDDAIQVVVTGEQDEGYNPSSATTATRTDTPLRDIPQSIQVVPRQVIEDRQPTNLVDALRSVPGISTQGQPSTSIYEEPVIRGFTATEFDILRNGLSTPYGGVSSFDSATVERVEVLRGPASVLFGQGSLGGVINVITEQPLSESQYSVEASAGSYNFYRGAIDLTGPLTEDGRLLYRLNLLARTTESFLDFFDRQQFTVAPTISWQITDNTNLSLFAEYINIDGAFGQFGLPARGTVLPNPNGDIPLSRNLGEPFANETTELFRVGYDLEHEFNQNWQLRSVFEAAWLWQNREIVTPSGLEPDDRTLLRRYLEGSIDARTLTFDNYVVGSFETGSIQHQLLVGVNYTRTDQDASETAGSRVAAAPIDIFDPVYNQPFGEPLDTPFEGEARSNAYGFYLQDQISLANNLRLVLGGRFDVANQRIVNTYPTDSYDLQQVFSPRVGLVYQPIPAISLYAAYGRSFRPLTNVFEGATVSDPERGTLYEVGVKADVSDRLSATLALYDQTRTNILTTDPNDLTRLIQVGAQNSEVYPIV